MNDTETISDSNSRPTDYLDHETVLVCPRCGSSEKLSLLEWMYVLARCEQFVRGAGGSVTCDYAGESEVGWGSQVPVEPLLVICNCGWEGAPSGLIAAIGDS